MLPTEIYTNYLNFARQSDEVLQSLNRNSMLVPFSKGYGLDYKVLHKNIKFIYKKLISVLSNKAVWNSFLQTGKVYNYNNADNTEVNLTDEILFLEHNRSEIIQQLDCMINTTIFEIDFKFLDTCFQKLQNVQNKLVIKGDFTSMRSAYQLAS